MSSAGEIRSHVDGKLQNPHYREAVDVPLPKNIERNSTEGGLALIYTRRDGQNMGIILSLKQPRKDRFSLSVEMPQELALVGPLVGDELLLKVVPESSPPNYSAMSFYDVYQDRQYVGKGVLRNFLNPIPQVYLANSLSAKIDYTFRFTLPPEIAPEATVLPVVVESTKEFKLAVLNEQQLVEFRKVHNILTRRYTK